MHRKRNVRDERPRSGCPCKEIFFLLPRLFKAGVGGWLVLAFELYENARVLRRLIPKRNLMGRKRRLAARAIGLDLKAFVDQPLVMELLDCPPDRFDVL